MDGRIRILRLLHFVGMEGGPYNQYSVAAPERQDIAICSFFPHEGPDVHPRLELVTGDGTVKGYLAALGRIEEAWDYDVVHAHTPHVAALYLLHCLVRRPRRRPRVYTLHSSYPLYNLRNRLTLLCIARFFDRFICCGEASRQSVPRLVRLLGRHPIDAIPNGVDFDRIDAVLAAEPPPSESESFVVAAVNRLVPGKNTEILLRVLRRVPGATLWIIGWGPERDRLEATARELGVAGRVEFHGRLPRQEVHRRLQGADLYVSASSGEGLPNAVLEAMACGVPVVLSDILPHREVDPSGECARFVRVGDVAGFSDEIRRHMAMAPRERSELGARCSRVVRDSFDVETMNRAYDALFGELVWRGRDRSPVGSEMSRTPA